MGRGVRLGNAVHTVVGVMPEGFAFPVAHGAWVPLRLNPLDYARREGPAIRVFGRLAPGVALEEAQAELTAIGSRMAADFPETHEHLRPEVMAFTVSQRTREIGIRVALGADARRIALAIFRRPLAQVGIGVLAGGGLAALLAGAVTWGGFSATTLALVAVYAALMMAVCMLACIVPTRRALRIEPTEALKEAR